MTWRGLVGVARRELRASAGNKLATRCAMREQQQWRRTGTRAMATREHWSSPQKALCFVCTPCAVLAVHPTEAGVARHRAGDHCDPGAPADASASDRRSHHDVETRRVDGAPASISESGPIRIEAGRGTQSSRASAAANSHSPESDPLCCQSDPPHSPHATHNLPRHQRAWRSRSWTLSALLAPSAACRRPSDRSMRCTARGLSRHRSCARHAVRRDWPQ